MSTTTTTAATSTWRSLYFTCAVVRGYSAASEVDRVRRNGCTLQGEEKSLWSQISANKPTLFPAILAISTVISTLILFACDKQEVLGGSYWFYCNMVLSLFSLHICYFCSSELIERKPGHLKYRPQLKSASISYSQENVLSRRFSIVTSGAILISILSGSIIALPIKAEEEKSPDDQMNEGDGGVFGAIKSIFDPNEKTKMGKLLPKAYLKDAKEVVKTLRESLEEDTKDASKFRRTADAAKESIRQYLSNWKGQPAVVAEESYAAIEKAIRSLANFYSKAGPFATMTEDVKASILNDLKTAEDFL